MRSLHQIVRSVLLTEGVGTPISTSELRKIALSTYMFRMFPDLYRKSYKLTDPIHKRVDFKTGRPFVERLNEAELAQFGKIYQDIILKYGSSTGDRKNKIKQEVNKAIDTGKALWPIGVMLPESSMYDKDIVPEDVYNELASIASKSAEYSPGELDLSRILPEVATPIRKISKICKALLESKNDQLQAMATEVIEAIKGIVEALSSAALDNERHDGSVDDFDSERFTFGSLFEMMSLKELDGIDLDDGGVETGAEAPVDATAVEPTTLSAEESASSDEDEELLQKLIEEVKALGETIGLDPQLTGDANTSDIPKTIESIVTLIESYLEDLET